MVTLASLFCDAQVNDHLPAKRHTDGKTRESMGTGWRLADALLRRRASRRIWKLKSLLNLTLCRLSVLRNQRNARCSHARSDIIQLLLLAHHGRALIRAELLIKEQNMVDAFAMVESYCHLLDDRAFLLKRQKECPEELKVAAAGLSFAASRSGELPELQEVRKILSSWFGKDFTAAAVELRNNCGVDARMVQKFSARQPSLESRVNVMKEIAMEKGVKLELITGHLSKVSEVDEYSSLWRENQVEEMGTPYLDSACHGDHKVKASAREEFEDAIGAAQVAFESASYAAAAAKAAVELFQSEAKRKGSFSENSSCMRMEPEDNIKHSVGNSVQEKDHARASKWRWQEQEMNPNISRDYCPLASRSSSIDNGFRRSKVRYPEMKLEKPGEEENLLESRSETVSRVWSYRELKAYETQPKVQSHADNKIEASSPNLAYQKRRPSIDEGDAESFSSDSEMEVGILSAYSFPGKNKAVHHAMGDDSPR